MECCNPFVLRLFLYLCFTTLTNVTPDRSPSMIELSTTMQENERLRSLEAILVAARRSKEQYDPCLCEVEEGPGQAGRTLRLPTDLDMV